MLVALAVLTLVVAVAAAWWQRRRGSTADVGGAVALDAADGLDPGDLAELDDRFDLVGDEDRVVQQTLLRSRIEPLLQRQVPVRAVEPIPELRTVRVRFADGTAVVAKGVIAGDAARLALLIRHHHHVVPSSCTTGPDGVRVVFGWERDRHHLALRVSGLDQPA